MPTLLRPEEVIGVIEEEGVCLSDYHMRDSAYALPDPKWLRNAFLPAYREAQSALGTVEYEENRNDCDKYARFLAWYASLLHARSKHAPVKTGLAVGEMVYVTDAGEPHDIALAVVREIAGLRVVWLDAQHGVEMAGPTESEKENVIYVAM